VECRAERITRIYFEPTDNAGTTACCFPFADGNLMVEIDNVHPAYPMGRLLIHDPFDSSLSRIAGFIASAVGHPVAIGRNTAPELTHEGRAVVELGADGLPKAGIAQLAPVGAPASQVPFVAPAAHGPFGAPETHVPFGAPVTHVPDERSGAATLPDIESGHAAPAAADESSTDVAL
jgi:hypothetical protein